MNADTDSGQECNNGGTQRGRKAPGALAAASKSQELAAGNNGAAAAASRESAKRKDKERTSKTAFRLNIRRIRSGAEPLKPGQLVGPWFCRVVCPVAGAPFSIQPIPSPQFNTLPSIYSLHPSFLIILTHLLQPLGPFFRRQDTGTYDIRSPVTTNDSPRRPLEEP